MFTAHGRNPAGGRGQVEQVEWGKKKKIRVSFTEARVIGLVSVIIEDRKGWRGKTQRDLKRDINVLKRQKTK